MATEYRYPPDLAEDTTEWEKTLRRFLILFGFGWWSAGLGFLILHEPPSWVPLVVAALMQTGVSLYRRSMRRIAARFRSIRDHRLELDQGRLRQVDGRGRVLGEIQLDEPFEVRRGAALNGVCLFEVVQPWPGGSTARVEFGSALEGAETLVREVLGSDAWPRPRLPR